MGQTAISIIGLHGVATSDEEVERGFELIRMHVGSRGIRWILPKARARPLSILGGCAALAWYDLKTCDRSQMDVGGLEEATETVCNIVKAERNRAPSGQRLVLMGFSQGGAVALNAGLRLGAEVDGIIALATALPFLDHIAPATSLSPPVFIGHGLLDLRIPYSFARETHRVLTANGYATEFRSYLYGHTTGHRQLRHVSQWLGQHVLDGRLATTLRPRALGHVVPA